MSELLEIPVIRENGECGYVILDPAAGTIFDPPPSHLLLGGATAEENEVVEVRWHLMATADLILAILAEGEAPRPCACETCPGMEGCYPPGCADCDCAICSLDCTYARGVENEVRSLPCDCANCDNADCPGRDA